MASRSITRRPLSRQIPDPRNMRKNLLVADDSITIQKVVRLTFAGEDVSVTVAADGDVALEKAREIKPDIVLADVCMPGKNGYELCATMKSDPELAHVPVVLVVGTFEPFDVSEAERVQYDGRLTKPFDTSELLQVVGSLIGLETSDVQGKEELKVHDSTIQEFGEPSVASMAGGLVSERTRESFLGADRILDIFPPDSQPLVYSPVPQESAGTSKTAEPLAHQEAAAELSDETINSIVERVLRHMSQEVIREVAWEVVPEMSELIIRQCLEEKGKP